MNKLQNDFNPKLLDMIPKLTPRELEGLRDYFEVLDAHRPEIAAYLAQTKGEYPEFGSVLPTLPPKQSGQKQGAENDLQRRAIFDGQWEPYLKSLQMQGREHAQTDLSFHSWSKIMGAFRALMMPHLIEAYAKSPERLLSAINGADIMLDLAYSVIGASYLETKELLILDQRRKIELGIEGTRVDEKFRGLLESAPDGAVIVNEKGEITIVNTQTEKIFGYERAEIVGKNVEVLFPKRFHNDHSHHRFGYFGDPHAGPMVGGLELFGLRRNGSEFPVEISLSPLLTGEGMIVRASIRDITGRKASENLLKESNEERFINIFNTNPVPTYIHGVADGRFIYLNDAFVDLNLMKREEMIGRTAAELNLSIINPEVHTEMIKQSHASGGRARNIETKFRTGNGELKDMLIFSDTIRIDGQECARVTMIDITERKRSESKVTQLNEELEAFSYSVSHDLRAPLRSIDGFSKALLEDFGGQIPLEGQGYLQRIRLAAQKMASLIDDLLDHSRVTRAHLKPVPIDISAMARSIANELEESQPERKVIFSIEPNLTANADLNLVKIVLENLLNNAWKFTGKQPNARIEFGSRQHDDRQEFFVRDNGAGFDMLYVDKLFGAFQRLHNERDFPGIGVGLATVQRIIHRHGGQVHAQGSIDHGATFMFSLS